MDEPNNKYSTQQITPQLISQIVDALRNKAYGSIEIYIENFNVVQITERKITKLARSRNQAKRFSITLRRGSNFSSTSQAK